jgi:hypothetical protein
LNYWLDVDAWELEDAVALTLGHRPDDLSEAVILEKSPDQIANRKLVGTQPGAFEALAQLYMERYERLKRAAIAGSLPSVKYGGKTWFKPRDFLPWYDTKSGWKDDFLPDAMKALLEAWRPRCAVNADRPAPLNTGPLGADHAEEKTPALMLSAPTVATVDIDDGKTEASFLGAPKGKKKLDACRAYLRSQMSSEDPELRGQAQYRNYCTKRFDISGRKFDAIWTEIANETKCAWARRGRPRKGREKAA